MPPKARNTDAEFDLAPPEAASLVESMRAFGYQLPSAIADLIDNSISARASNIWVVFDWVGNQSVISVTDDGRGMAPNDLVQAMRPGSKNPREFREAGDLGRFGLGLKTASFSQCRKVTVRSHSRDSDPATRCWDLDHIASVNDWQLLRSADTDAERHFERLQKLRTGTTVVWQVLDRLTRDFNTQDDRHQDIFLASAEAVREHLGMVFHRMLSGTEPVRMFVNEIPVEPWDPFLTGESATQTLATTPLLFRGKTVHVQPFVLPHQSKISKKTHQAAAGPRGWNAHQGFYVYRNDRLLVPGDWLGLGWSKEEHYKLARIAVDVPTELDLDWDIDVTKSRASPPPGLRGDLRRIAERTRSDAKKVYSFRGARLTTVADNARTLLWHPVAKHDKTYYRLNRDHPLLRNVLAASSDRPAMAALLRLIEETVPYPHITITNSENPSGLPGPFEHETEKAIRKVMDETHRALIESGYTHAGAVDRLRTLWPFELFPALLQTLLESQADD